MPGCVLRVTTKTEQVDAAVNASGLRPIAVFNRGAPKVPGGARVAASSGFNVEVSESEDLDEQVRDAVRFLKRHAVGLRRLHRLRIFGGMTLDFASGDRGTENVPWPSYRFPFALVELAGKHRIEIELSIYGVKPLDPP